MKYCSIHVHVLHRPVIVMILFHIRTDIIGRYWIILLIWFKALHSSVLLSIEPRCEKTGLRVSDQVRHKLGCAATEDGLRLEISDLGRKGIVLSM